MIKKRNKNEPGSLGALEIVAGDLYLVHEHLGNWLASPGSIYGCPAEWKETWKGEGMGGEERGGKGMVLEAAGEPGGEVPTECSQAIGLGQSPGPLQRAAQV